MKFGIFGKAMLLAGVLSFGGVSAGTSCGCKHETIYGKLALAAAAEAEAGEGAVEAIQAYTSQCLSKNVSDEVNCDELFVYAREAFALLEKRRAAKEAAEKSAEAFAKLMAMDATFIEASKK